MGEKRRMWSDADGNLTLRYSPSSSPLCLYWLREAHSRTFFPFSCLTTTVKLHPPVPSFIVPSPFSIFPPASSFFCLRRRWWDNCYARAIYRLVLTLYFSDTLRWLCQPHPFAVSRRAINFILVQITSQCHDLNLETDVSASTRVQRHSNLVRNTGRKMTKIALHSFSRCCTQSGYSPILWRINRQRIIVPWGVVMKSPNCTIDREQWSGQMQSIDARSENNACLFSILFGAGSQRAALFSQKIDPLPLN